VRLVLVCGRCWGGIYFLKLIGPWLGIGLFSFLRVLGDTHICRASSCTLHKWLFLVFW
jgi:hypothetical protein